MQADKKAKSTSAPDVALTGSGVNTGSFLNIQHNAIPRPFVKWVGGKRQLLPVLRENSPNSFGHYFEPFIGGGAFFFSNLPRNATISDINPELINCYQIIRDDVDALIRSLRRHKNNEDYYYSMRSKDVFCMSNVQRASRFIYLNKTCFNGLYRENSSGRFNSPYGRYENPKILDTDNLLAISNYLKNANIDIRLSSYQYILEEASAGDFVYLDPPYAPLTKTANFASYNKSGFGKEDQINLARVFRKLGESGVFVMQSNSNTDFIHNLYSDFNIKVVSANRSINSNGLKRGKAPNEVIITNYSL